MINWIAYLTLSIIPITTTCRSSYFSYGRFMNYFTMIWQNGRNFHSFIHIYNGMTFETDWGQPCVDSPPSCQQTENITVRDVPLNTSRSVTVCVNEWQIFCIMWLLLTNLFLFHNLSWYDNIINVTIIKIHNVDEHWCTLNTLYTFLK